MAPAARAEPVGAMTDSGSSSVTVTGAGRDFHAWPDETQPQYDAHPDPEGCLVQDGKGGATYANSVRAYTAGTSAHTGNLHGGGVLDIQGFSFNGWHSQTVEFFYRTPGGTDWDAAKANQARILMLGPSGFGTSSSYLVEIRLLTDGRLYGQHSGNGASIAGALNQQPLAPDTWYHLAYVGIDSAGDGNFPAETFRDRGGNEVSFEAGRAYFFLDGVLGFAGEHCSAAEGGERMWLGGYPPNGAGWQDPTGARLDATAIGHFDEVRLTHQSGGTHRDAAALHPDQFLRFVPGFAPRFEAVELTEATTLTFDTRIGVTYRLEVAEDPEGTNWVYAGVSLVGNGSVMSFFDPAGYSPSKRYRIVPQ